MQVQCKLSSYFCELSSYGQKSSIQGICVFMFSVQKSGLQSVEEILTFVGGLFLRVILSVLKHLGFFD